MPPEAVPWWRYMWIAIMADGHVYSQFGADGTKLEWENLPGKPVKVALVPFTKQLALKVRSAAQIPALDIEAKPVELEDFGEGVMAGQDRRMHLTLLVQCITCGHTWPFNAASKAQCPKCGVKDEFFCTDCQANREPFVVKVPPTENAPARTMLLCPVCKSQGRTRGLKRIMKFKIAGSKLYVTHYWIRSPPVEVRITDEGTITHPWREPLPEIPQKQLKPQ